MIQIVKADNRHFSDFGWLKTYWLFSFSNYYDPQNIQFGALRVFNDDIVDPGSGFPTHPHEEMEIITIVLDGEMTHKDSMGNETVIKAGDVQRMSAGTGLTHSEYNLAEIPVHFYQIWIYPDEAGLAPSYDQKRFDTQEWHNKLFPVASGQKIPGAVTFHSNATIYRCKLDKGKDVIHKFTDGRRIFLYLTEGCILANDKMLVSKDQARIDIENQLIVNAQEDSDFILIDVPSCKGWGYSTEILKGDK
ncbi:putative Quercetin 2,3-dioxygenase [Desulfamplus magnetovallimortis]|uniref:Putative Quercetin 2,3-dioxygenase n=1 Tax=Desulfamplus magnetovallimortis TaxID=1246637 RepID=A0A1W1HJ08_9BACT|nr:pirin-like bicupin family protein [Desulfamplus magnetovallimortis]SLM32352.1 putative Quercetin 2,3-dioxygenase [Desulfamplus magnetovallimortis]